MVHPSSPPPWPPGHPASGPPGYPVPMAQRPAPLVPYSPYAPVLPAYGVDPVTGVPLSDKSKTAAGLLQVFLPGFAVGRFYTGHIGLAVGQLAVGWGVFIVMGCLGWVLVFPWLFSWMGFMWAFVDGFVLLGGRPTDAQGRLLR